MAKPELESFPAYYQPYVKNVSSETVGGALAENWNEILSFFKGLSPEQQSHRYEDGKWSPKEILQHLIDAERILSQRALRFSRNDMTQLPGYDHDAYVERATLDHREISDMVDELALVRQATIALYASFTEAMLKREGFANGMVVSVEKQAYIIAGHAMHHTNVIKERYL